MKPFIGMSLVLCVAVAAQAARRATDPPPIAAEQVAHQVTVAWTPSLDAGGRQLVRLTVGYERSANAPAYDMLIVVARPSNRVLMRVVDPGSAMAEREKSLEASGHATALVTAYATLDHFTQSAVLPYDPGDDQHLFIAARRGNSVIVLARTKADLSSAVKFTATTTDEPVTSPGIGRLHAIAETYYCYESDWCQPQCVYCNSEPTWDSYACTVICNDTPGCPIDDCRCDDSCPWDDMSVPSPGKRAGS